MREPGCFAPALLLALSLRFNHEEFCDGLYLHRKTLAIAVFISSGAPLEGRVALGSAGKPAFGPPRRSPAGFRRLGGRADLHQKRRNDAMDPNRCQPSRIVAPLPRQPPIRHARSGQAHLREGGDHQPRPKVGLLGVAHARGGPSERLLEKPEGVLQVEAPYVGAPEEIEVRRCTLRPVPPQPQNPWLAPPLASRQPLDLHKDERPDHDWQGTTAAPPLMVLDLGVHLCPRSHAHRSVTGVLADVLGGGRGPGQGVRALHLGPVAARTSDVRGRVAETGVAVEAASRPQPHEYLARAPFESSLQFDGVVARVKDEQRYGPHFPEPPQQSPDLLSGERVRLPIRPETLHVNGSGPALAHETKLCDELVGPAGDDGLACGVPRRVVVVAALGARLGVAPGPDARVHSEDERFIRAARGERMAGEELAQGLGVDPSAIQRGVEAAPAATVRGLEAQMSWRRNG